MKAYLHILQADLDEAKSQDFNRHLADLTDKLGPNEKFTKHANETMNQLFVSITVGPK